MRVPRARRNAPAARLSPKKLGKLWWAERRRSRASHSAVIGVPWASVQTTKGRRGSTAAARRSRVRRRPTSRASIEDDEQAGHEDVDGIEDVVVGAERQHEEGHDAPALEEQGHRPDHERGGEVRVAELDAVQRLVRDAVAHGDGDEEGEEPRFAPAAPAADPVDAGQGGRDRERRRGRRRRRGWPPCPAARRPASRRRWWGTARPSPPSRPSGRGTSP